MEDRMSIAGRMARATGTWIPAALARPFGAPAAVFFHGVERHLTDPAIQINQHALDAFENMARLIKRDFDVLPLAALAEVRKRPGKHSRALFLMSDDGYANTLDVAADVLGGLGLPWTLFVSTHHIDTGTLNPMTVARAFFLLAPEGQYEIAQLGAFSLNGEREATAQRLLSALKKLDAAKANEAVAGMQAALGNAGIDLARRFPSERFLSWDEVCALDRRGVEIGAHADWHWPMHAHQSTEYLREQAERPKRRIEEEVGACRAFAYPFGQRADIARAAWQAVRDAGYAHAFTTIAGTLDAGANDFLLPRYGLARQESNLAALLAVMRANNPRLRQWQSRIGT
jgi:peptidoglycan/xylan/chitin deacetylase (PgdA/CDA1 family)